MEKTEIKTDWSQIGEEEKNEKKRSTLEFYTIFIWRVSTDRKLLSVFSSISHLISCTD